MLLTSGGNVRRLILWYQCYEFIAYWWSSLTVLGLFNIIRHKLVQNCQINLLNRTSLARLLRRYMEENYDVPSIEYFT